MSDLVYESDDEHQDLDVLSLTSVAVFDAAQMSDERRNDFVVWMWYGEMREPDE